MEPAALEALPLRARKKARTRQALVEAAQRHFLERGFAATTLEDICADVDVHVRTLLRYFGTKEELALASEYEALGQLEALLRSPEGAGSVLDAWRTNLDVAADRLQHDPAVGRYTRFILAEPSLAALRADILRQHEDLLADELAREVGPGRRKALRARLLAAMLIGGMRAAAVQWQADGGRTDLAKSFAEVVDEAQGAFPEWRVEASQPSRVRRKASSDRRATSGR